MLHSIPCLASIRNIGAGYVPLMDRAVARTRDLCGDTIASIRLMGSVARGDARLGQSDVDFVVLLRSELSAAEFEALEQVARDLVHEFPIAPRVDLEALQLDQLTEFRKFVLITDSVVMFGEDDLPGPPYSVTTEALIAMVTPNLQEITAGYQDEVARLDDADNAAILKYSRLAGKDSLKCLRPIALRQCLPYERSVEGIYLQLRDLLPEHAELLAELWALYMAPSSDRSRITAALMRCQVEMATAIIGAL